MRTYKFRANRAEVGLKPPAPEVWKNVLTTKSTHCTAHSDVRTNHKMYLYIKCRKLLQKNNFKSSSSSSSYSDGEFPHESNAHQPYDLENSHYHELVWPNITEPLVQELSGRLWSRRRSSKVFQLFHWNKKRKKLFSSSNTIILGMSLFNHMLSSKSIKMFFVFFEWLKSLKWLTDASNRHKGIIILCNLWSDYTSSFK